MSDRSSPSARSPARTGGSIINVSVTSTGDFTSTVDGGSQSGLSAGGLAGFNIGTITGSTAAVKVTVGDGTICSGTDCTGGGLNFAGGLVGNNSTNNGSGGTISGSFASGNVSGGNNTIIGGLVGENTGAITNSYATGDVSVTTTVSGNDNNFNSSFGGGLVGQNGNGGGPPDNIGTITSSYATGNVTGIGLNLAVGGLAGDNSAGSFITDSQATGSVTANTDGTPQSQYGNSVNAGGLVGYNQGTVAGSTTPPFSQRRLDRYGLARIIRGAAPELRAGRFLFVRQRRRERGRARPGRRACRQQ